MTYKLTVNKITDNTAELSNENEINITWPLKELPAETKTGDSLYFHIHSDKGLNTNEKEIATDILNEILHID